MRRFVFTHQKQQEKCATVKRERGLQSHRAAGRHRQKKPKKKTPEILWKCFMGLKGWSKEKVAWNLSGPSVACTDPIKMSPLWLKADGLVLRRVRKMQHSSTSALSHPHSFGKLNSTKSVINSPFVKIVLLKRLREPVKSAGDLPFITIFT